MVLCLKAWKSRTLPGISFMFEKLKYNNKIIAIVIKSSFTSKETKFFTKHNSEFQIGSIVHKKDSLVKKHSHYRRNSKIKSTSEVLYIKKGNLIISLYNKKCSKLLYKKNLSRGDIIFLNECGHSLSFKKDTQIIEIKQGPYEYGKDKKIY
tara:strand:- start:830 stop:1282 length:453 start_codon:yes stop_codon:yes gene_type:complete